MNVKDLRHCLIEHINKNELYVANDIILGTDNINGTLLYVVDVPFITPLILIKIS